MDTGRRQKTRRGCAVVAVGLLVIPVIAFLLHFPGRQSLLAITLTSGLGLDRLQARVDALEEKAINGDQFTEADVTFLDDLYTCFAKGARLTFVLRQSGQLMDHYLSRTGEPLQIEPRIFLNSLAVHEQMGLLKQRLGQDLREHRTLADEYASETFHMGKPILLDSKVGLYFGRIRLHPHLLDDNRLLLQWRADMPWQWPSYESLHEKYGDYHAQCFPLPNARSILRGSEYHLWVDDGLGEYIVQLGLAKPFLVWSAWDEEADVDMVVEIQP